MNIADIMTSPVSFINPQASLTDAARIMRDRDVGCLPVCVGRQVVGILTDRDIVVRAAAHGLDLKTVPAADAMTNDVICCFETDDADDVASLMEDRLVRRVPVIDKQSRTLVGIVSLGDIARDITSDDSQTARVLRSQFVETGHHH